MSVCFCTQHNPQSGKVLLGVCWPTSVQANTKTNKSILSRLHISSVLAAPSDYHTRTSCWWRSLNPFLFWPVLANEQCSLSIPLIRMNLIIDNQYWTNLMKQWNSNSGRSSDKLRRPAPPNVHRICTCAVHTKPFQYHIGVLASRILILKC